MPVSLPMIYHGQRTIIQPLLNLLVWEKNCVKHLWSSYWVLVRDFCGSICSWATQQFPIPLQKGCATTTSLYPSCPAALPPASPVTAESSNWFCHTQMPAATSTAPKSFSFFKWCWAGRHTWAVSVQLCTVAVMYHAEGNLRRFQD